MINRLLKLFSGGLDSPLNRQEQAMPDENAKKIVTNNIPVKFRADVEKLQELFNDELTTGLHINWTLRQALEAVPKERKRVDAYDSLAKYLSEKWGITLTITSQKIK